MEYREFEGSVFSARVFFEAQQEIAGNLSRVTVHRVEVKSNRGAYGTFWVTGTVRIGGNTAATLVLNSAQACGVYLAPNGDFGGGGADIWNTAFRVETVPVYHGTDGTGSMELSVDLALTRTNNTHLGRLSGTAAVELPRIPRASGLTAEAGALGEEMRIRLLPLAEGMTDVLTWRCGEESGSLGAVGQEISWFPPVRLAEQAPNADTAEVYLTVTTMVGETEIGSNTICIQCPIPDSIVPRVSAVLTDAAGYRERFGGFVQGQSRLRVEVSAEGQYGAEITEIRMDCGGLTAGGAEAVFALLRSGGTSIRVTATDSRGRQSVWQETVAVQSYETPAVQLLRSDRNTETSGEIQFAVRFSELNGNNTLQVFLQKRLRGTDSWQETELAGEGICHFQAEPENAYECRIAVRDAFSWGYSLISVVPVAFALLDICKADHAIGIGQRANARDTLSIGLDTSLSGHRMKDLAEPVEAADAVTLGYLLRLLEERGA